MPLGTSAVVLGAGDVIRQHSAARGRGRRAGLWLATGLGVQAGGGQGLSPAGDGAHGRAGTWQSCAGAGISPHGAGLSWCCGTMRFSRLP